MTTNVDPRHYVLRLRPKVGLFLTALVSILLVALALFGVLFFLGLRTGAWPLAVVGMSLTLVLCWVGLARFRATFIAVTPSAIVERGYWGTQSTALRSEVASIVLVSVESRGVPEPVYQLIVRDSNGARLLRMRGAYWTVEAMRSVIAALDVTPTLPAEVMTREEFFSTHPGAAYWYERQRWLYWTLIIVSAVAGAALLLELVRLVEVPFAG